MIGRPELGRLVGQLADWTVLAPWLQAVASRPAQLFLFGLLLVAGVTAYVGRRYGKEPPRPIRTELPDLPKGAPGVEGRKARPPEA